MTNSQARMERRVIGASVAGNFTEWYEFGVYGILATVLADQFFPAGNDVLALISTYAIFASAYIARPAGGLLFGWIGDKWGRRTSLMITILGMCTATAVIGLIPSYANIGYAAPIILLLCRLAQGVCVGGEYAGAATFLYEHSREGHRAKNLSYLMAATFLGVLSASGLGSLVSATLGDAAFNAWGWRALFLVAIPLGAVGVYLRLRVDETPEFKRVAAADAATEEKPVVPIRDAFAWHWREMLVFIGCVGLYALISVVTSSYYTTFMISTAGIPNSAAYTITLIGQFVLVAVILMAGRHVERTGVRKMLLFGALFVVIFGAPSFFVANQGYVGAVIGMTMLAFAKGILATPVVLLTSQMFRPEVRVTAGATSYNVTTLLFGGTGPLLGVWLSNQTGSGSTFGVYLAAVAGLSLIAALWSTRYLRQEWAKTSTVGGRLERALR